MDHHPFTIDVCGFFWQELCRLPANAVVVEALSTLFFVVVLFCLVLQSGNLGYFFFFNLTKTCFLADRINEKKPFSGLPEKHQSTTEAALLRVRMASHRKGFQPVKDD